MEKIFEKIYQLLIENYIYFTFKLLNIKEFRCRELTRGEVLIAKNIFDNLINYNSIKVFNIPYLPWQPINILMAPNGHLFINKEVFLEDYSMCSITTQGLFIHELTHVLQHQKHKNVFIRGALLQTAYYITFKKYDPYRYTLIKGKKFEQYNIEQQAEIARDIFLKKIPNIIIHS